MAMRITMLSSAFSEYEEPRRAHPRRAKTRDTVVEFFWADKVDLHPSLVEVVVDAETVVRIVPNNPDENDGTDWVQVPEAAVASGFQRLLGRESKLEAAAGRFGVDPDSLVEWLDRFSIDIARMDAMLPEEEASALRDAGINLEGPTDDPTGAGELLKGQAAVQRLISGGLTVRAAAAVLQVTEGRVRQMVSAGDVVTVQGPGGQLLPAWQFIDQQLVPGLRALAEVAAHVHPLSLQGFMLRVDPDLEMNGEAASPVVWLLGGGNPGRISDLAQGLLVPA